MVFLGKWKEYRITDVGEILQVLRMSMKLNSSSTDAIRTHFKVNWK